MGSCSLRPRCFLSPHCLAPTGFKFYTSRAMAPKKVCIVGSGNWGSAIARLVGFNAARLPERFQKEVAMWVFEEEVNGRKLTEIINTDHENVKYLPGRKLPENIRAVPDIVTAAQDADFLIIVLPHQFIERSIQPLKGKLKPGASCISLVKGFDILPTGGIQLISDVLKKHLNIPVAVLMGVIFKSMFDTPNFRVTVVNDAVTVEMCGALKN